MQKKKKNIQKFSNFITVIFFSPLKRQTPWFSKMARLVYIPATTLLAQFQSSSPRPFSRFANYRPLLFLSNVSRRVAECTVLLGALSSRVSFLDRLEHPRPSHRVAFDSLLSWSRAFPGGKSLNFLALMSRRVSYYRESKLDFRGSSCCSFATWCLAFFTTRGTGDLTHVCSSIALEFCMNSLPIFFFPRGSVGLYEIFRGEEEYYGTIF